MTGLGPDSGSIAWACRRNWFRFARMLIVATGGRVKADLPGDGLFGPSAANWVRFAHFSPATPPRATPSDAAQPVPAPGELGSFRTNERRRDAESTGGGVEVASVANLRRRCVCCRSPGTLRSGACLSVIRVYVALLSYKRTDSLSSEIAPEFAEICAWDGIRRDRIRAAPMQSVIPFDKGGHRRYKLFKRSVMNMC